MEAVIKVGGSLAEHPAALRRLCRELGLFAKAHGILIVPGGGKFADFTRELDQKFGLTDTIAHEMAILAMDQFGLFLSSLTPNSHVSYRLKEARRLSETGTLPILLLSRLMFREDPLEHSWDVTSDSIAAYIAGKLNAEKLVLATDVDGVFTADPKMDPNAKLIERLSADDLLGWNRRTSVDKFLPKILQKTRVNCYVVNGRHPERLWAILEGKETVCTRIIV